MGVSERKRKRASERMGRIFERIGRISVRKRERETLWTAHTSTHKTNGLRPLDLRAPKTFVWHCLCMRQRDPNAYESQMILRVEDKVAYWSHL